MGAELIDIQVRRTPVVPIAKRHQDRTGCKCRHRQRQGNRQEFTENRAAVNLCAFPDFSGNIAEKCSKQDNVKRRTDLGNDQNPHRIVPVQELRNQNVRRN